MAQFPDTPKESQAPEFSDPPEKSTTPPTGESPAIPEKYLRGKDKFKVKSHSNEEETAFDLVGARKVKKPTGTLVSIFALVKSALGAGMLCGHVGYKDAGWVVATVVLVVLGLALMYCMYRLVVVSDILCRRTQIPSMTYSDLVECTFILCGRPIFMRLSKAARILTDVCIYCDLGGACITYQLIIAKGIKQLIEDTQDTSIFPLRPGYPSLRVYMLILLVPFLAIAMIRHIAWLAPMASVANLVSLLCILVTVHYATVENPEYKYLIAARGGFKGFFQFVGMAAFSLCCASTIFSLENNMRDPKKFPVVIIIGLSLIVLGSATMGFFGYVAYLDKSVAPITLNFPMETFPKILKVLIIIMIYMTLALNFWVPFDVIFYYIKPKLQQETVIFYEYLTRAALCLAMNVIGIIYPNVSGVMSLAGCFGIIQLSFVWPSLIELLVQWERPGLGRYKWRLWKCLIIIICGVFVFASGTYVNILDMIESFKRPEKMSLRFKQNQIEKDVEM